VTQAWHNLLDGLGSLAGTRQVVSIAPAERFRIVYIETQLTPAVIQNRISLSGFVANPLASTRIERLGTAIVIPQNQG